MKWGNTKNGSSISSLILLLPFFTLIHTSDGTKPDKKSFWCCKGWSDDLTLSPPQVDTRKCEGENFCMGQVYCNGNSTSGSGLGSECATTWICQKRDLPKNITATECSDPKLADGACYCDTDWCNCPKSLKGVKTPPVDKTLKCCYGENNEGNRIEVIEQSDWCGAYVRANVTAWYGAEFNWLARLREDCYRWTFKEYDGRGEACICKTNYCNCPPNLRELGKNQGAKISSSHFTVLLILCHHL